MNPSNQELNLDPELNQKYQHLKEILQQYKKVIIAFSGGVDSTFLAKATKDVLLDQSLAIIGMSSIIPERESKSAVELAQLIGIPYLTLSRKELKLSEFLENKKDRCYVCKKDIYSKLVQLKQDWNYHEIIDGTNKSDLNDHRPGLKALEELNIKTPLLDANLNKTDIRNLSLYLDLPTWNKISFSCLATRIPFGNRITKESLSMIDQGELVLLQLGFSQFRLRYHQDIARIELDQKEFQKLLQEDVRKQITQKLSELGFKYVTLDLVGYRTGGGFLNNS